MVWLPLLGLVSGPVIASLDSGGVTPPVTVSRVSRQRPAQPPQDCSGAILFLRHSNKIVSLRTDSNVTHVAVILRQGGMNWVYEATPARVRRRALSHYLLELSRLNERRKTPMEAWVLAPQARLATSESRALAVFLEGQLGRRYSVRGYVRQEPSAGVHCAELAAMALNKTESCHFGECYQVTPAELIARLAPKYTRPVKLTLPALPERTWRQRMSARWGGFRSWCGWAGGETIQWVSGS